MCVLQENKMFYDVTTKEDPIIEKLAVDNTGDVYATGHYYQTYIHTYSNFRNLCSSPFIGYKYIMHMCIETLTYLHTNTYISTYLRTYSTCIQLFYCCTLIKTFCRFLYFHNYLQIASSPSLWPPLARCTAGILLYKRFCYPTIIFTCIYL